MSVVSRGGQILPSHKIPTEFLSKNTKFGASYHIQGGFWCRIEIVTANSVPSQKFAALYQIIAA